MSQIGRGVPAFFVVVGCSMLIGCSTGSPTFGGRWSDTGTPARLADGRPGPGYWQQQADYDIDARLDPSTGLVTASLRLNYTNNSPADLEYLWFELPQNVHRPDSRGAMSARETDRFPAERSDRLGFQIQSVRENGRDASMAVDDTRGRVSLGSPVAARGGTTTIEIDFSFYCPNPGGLRMGYLGHADGPVYEFAQWFPNVCVYDDVRGWNTLPYLGQGEFYTNFGSYNVNLTVPRDYIVAATGTLSNPREVLTDAQMGRLDAARESDEAVMIVSADEVGSAASRPVGTGDLTWRFGADDVRTFAWACSPVFVWDACAAATENEERVLCMSFYPPSSAPAWSKSTSFVKHAVEFYSDFLGTPYPYPVMSNICGVEYGMEYPMIIFCGDTRNEDELFFTTDHEVAHTWFPMLVNTNERLHPWMDEGFNSFVNMYSGGAFKGEKSREEQVDEIVSDSPGDIQQTIVDQPDAMPSWYELGYLAYSKPGYGLWLLREEILGPARFDDAFARYIRAWSYKSPTPDDFWRAMENASGEDLSWFRIGYFENTGSIDLGITEADSNQRIWTATIESYGSIMPFEVELTFDDGSTRLIRYPVETWHRQYQWDLVGSSDGKRVTKIVIDPRNRLPDVDRNDNAIEIPQGDAGQGDDEMEQPPAGEDEG